MRCSQKECYLSRTAAEDELRRIAGRNVSDLLNAEVYQYSSCGFYHIRWQRPRRDALVLIKREAVP
jgi:hypothetical protein